MNSIPPPLPHTSKGTPLRDLLQDYVDQLPPPSRRNDHNRCLAVLAPILTFGYNGRSTVSGLSQYTSDSCLFELACFILASADLWAFSNAPEKRSKIQQILFSQLDAISSRSGFLPEQAAYDYANSRVAVYGSIAASSSGAQGLHLRLQQALLHASTNPTPTRDLDSIPPIFGDAISCLDLTRAMVDWDMSRLMEMDSALSAIV